MEIGQRRIQPIHNEIQTIIQMEPIPIKIYFLDGTFKNVLITSQTRTEQIMNTLSEILKSNHCKSFGLFEMEQITYGWGKRMYSKRKLMNEQEKIDGLQDMPCDRELEMNERIMDVVSSWIRAVHKKKKKNKDFKLIFKCKLHSVAQENSYSFYDWKLSFLTSVYNVIHKMYPVQDDDIWNLAALQLQGIYGLKDNYEIFYSSGIIQDVISKFVPYKILENYNAKECEIKILLKHKLYKHLDKVSAYRKYIQYLRKSNASIYFGNSFFRCVRVTRLRKVKMNNEIIDLLIGISENGILFIDPLSLKIIDRYKMEEIITYGFRSNAFLLVAGTLMTHRKFQFATMIGKQMNDLLTQHIDLRVQQAKAQGYVFQN
eukprot:20213_1